LVRRMTPSQYNSWLRQQQNQYNQAVRRHNQQVDRINRANKAAIEKTVRDYNREVDRVNQHNKRVADDNNRRARQHNENARAAVAKYNQAVRAHNAQVERDRRRRLSALRAPTATRYVEVRDSTLELSERFDRVERSVGATAYADLVALSEKEASNSAAVAEALVADESKAPESAPDTGILEYLAGFSQDLCDRWRGALFSLNPANPDAGRHFCTSVREIFTEILDRWADNEDVLEADPNCELTPNKTGPSRRAKIRYLLKRKGADTPEMLGFVEKDIDDILQLFHVFNEATHGAAGKHGFSKLQSIRQRVEGGIMFLAAVAL
jgi:Predicted pPIWI-associating nuclease